MTGPRRTVRATAQFFLRLDQLLPAERAAGRPSRVDFETHELLRAVEEFATRFDELAPLIPGRPDYRILIATGRLVFAYTILGQLAHDGAVELTDIEIQFTPPLPARPDDQDEDEDDDGE